MTISKSEINDSRIEMLNVQLENAIFYLDSVYYPSEKLVWTAEIRRVTKALAKARAA